MGRGTGLERARRRSSCSVGVSKSCNEGEASLWQMVGADQSNRPIERGIVGGSGTSCPYPAHSLETSPRARAFTQASLPGDGRPILKPLKENKQVMGKVDHSCLCVLEEHQCMARTERSFSLVSCLSAEGALGLTPVSIDRLLMVAKLRWLFCR